MKILFYSPHPHIGFNDLSGNAAHMRGMVNAFKNLGHQVFPFIAGSDGSAMTNTVVAQPSLIKKAVHYFVPELFWETARDVNLLLLDAKLRKRLYEKLIKLQPDIIIEQASYLQSSGMDALSSFRKYSHSGKTSHILVIHAPLIEEKNYLSGANSMLSGKAKAIVKKQLFSCDKMLVVSSALREYFLKKYGVSPEKILVMPNGINSEEIKINTSRVKDLKNKYALNDCCVIGFVGSIFPYHGVDILIHAFHLLKKDNYKIKLLIVGDGFILGELRELCNNLGIADSVIFCGYIPGEDVFNYIEAMDICVLPKTKFYMSPIKLFEYGALGKAVIAADTIAVRDVVENNKHGILIPPDKKNLSDTILKLVENASLRTFLGKNIREKVLKEHTWEQNAQKILSSL